MLGNEAMRVLIGITILLGLIGAVVLVITAEDVRSALAWTAVTDWGDFTVNLPLIVAIIAGIGVFVLSIPWRSEMDALRPAWIGLSAGVLTLLVSFGMWATFALWIVNLFRVRVVEPSQFALWVTAIWFVGTVLWWAWLVWSHRRWRVETVVQRRDFTVPGPRSFAGEIVAAPGEPLQRDPLYGGACVSWSADGTSEDVWEENVGKWDEATHEVKDNWVQTFRQRNESTNFDSAASAFYVLVGSTYVYVRPADVTMSGRIGVRATIESLRFADRTLAEHAERLGLSYIRTRLLRVGDAVVASGVITADAEGRLSMQAKPQGRWRGALVPTASVRLLGKGPRDRRHRQAMKAAT